MPPSCPVPHRGFSLLELAVSLAVIAVFAGVLLQRLQFYQEAAEKARIELEVTKLKLALQARVGAQIAEQRPVDFAAVARENPMSWLDQPMTGYRGESGPAEARLVPPGSWYFDRDRLELVYRPVRDRYLAPDSTGRKRVRIKVEVLRARAGARKDDDAMRGLQLRLVETYRWF